MMQPTSSPNHQSQEYQILESSSRRKYDNSDLIFQRKTAKKPKDSKEGHRNKKMRKEEAKKEDSEVGLPAPVKETKIDNYVMTKSPVASSNVEDAFMNSIKELLQLSFHSLVKMLPHIVDLLV